MLLAFIVATSARRGKSSLSNTYHWSGASVVVDVVEVEVDVTDVVEVTVEVNDVDVAEVDVEVDDVMVVTVEVDVVNVVDVDVEVDDVNVVVFSSLLSAPNMTCSTVRAACKKATGEPRPPPGRATVFGAMSLRNDQM
mmetsp:Transcript_69039/g.200313  ORF Transcript_69039/g.200313 Transcript_69039/m.200313 type:complete len:138 (-) Transcript_69039:329-742(-)